MSGHHILEGVVILHETVHVLHKNKMGGVLFKIDFETYEKVRSLVFPQVLWLKCFDHKWYELVAKYVRGRSIGF
jgi:hypothetical protein